MAEWIIYLLLTTCRRLDNYLNTTKELAFPLTPPPIGLAGKNVTILGRGNIGKLAGKICEAFEMNVTYFARGDDLVKSVKNSDVIIDTLSSNPSSKGLLSKDFFDSLKKGAVFISPTTKSIVDIDAMLAALDSGQLAYVGHDVMDARPADTTDPVYERLRQHPKVFATPHIAGFSDVTTRIGNDTMIDNVEAWLKGKPINVVG